MEDKWNLEFYHRIINKCEYIIAEESKNYKVEHDINYYFLFTYAKAILNTREVLCLLANGYPDGALSRARNIYEQMIIASYIFENFSKELIERYFADNKLQVYKNRKLSYKIMGTIIPNTQEKYLQLKEKCIKEIKTIEQQYGKNRGNYWWIPDSKINSFGDLQNYVGAKPLIILYKRACISTHAGALNDIALLGRDNREGSLLRTDQTWDGFEAPLLLSIGSFDILTQIIFKHFELELPDGYNLKEKYVRLWKKVFD